MKDEDLLEQFLDDAGTNDPRIKQAAKTLAKDVRADENAACEALAVANESKRTADGIRGRREN